jgi:hypothetical protein
MILDTEQLEYMTSIAALQGTDDSLHPSLLDVSKKVHSERVKRREASLWMYQAPWHGTESVVRTLEKLGLVEVHVGAAQFHAPNEPASTAETYWVALTDRGHEVLTREALEQG